MATSPKSIIAGLLLAALASSAIAAEVPVVRVDAVRNEPLVQWLPVVGRLIALQSGVVASRIAGAVEEVRVQVGDRVEKGTPLVLLDDDYLTAERDLWAAELAVAEAREAAAAAELALRRQELARLEGLQRSPAFNEARFLDQRQEVMIADARRGEAAAAIARARAQLRSAEIALADSRIRAPYAGVITRRQAVVGARLDEGDAAVSMIDDRSLEVEADVPADRIAGLKPGTPVATEFDGRTLTCSVRAVLPEENPMTRTRTVRLTADFAGIGDLAAGRSVVLQMPLSAARSGITVHKDAVLYRSGDTFVFKVAGDRATLQRVRLGEPFGSRFEVIEGLQEGEPVVVRGNERLQPGQAVTVAAEKTG